MNELLAFALTALVIELTPGPNMTYLAALSLSSGMRTGLAAVTGIALGLATYGIIAAFGLAAVIDESPLLYSLLRWGGVLYLLWLAWESWTGGNEALSETGDERSWAAFRRGLITNLLNPKAALFYVAVLPDFVRPDSWTVRNQTLVLSLIYVAIATAIHSSIVVMAGTLQNFVTSASRQRIVRRVLSLLLAAIAIWFAWSTARSS